MLRAAIAGLVVIVTIVAIAVYANFSITCQSG